jgi:hypothetical protein
MAVSVQNARDKPIRALKCTMLWLMLVFRCYWILATSIDSSMTVWVCDCRGSIGENDGRCRCSVFGSIPTPAEGFGGGAHKEGGGLVEYFLLNGEGNRIEVYQLAIPHIGCAHMGVFFEDILQFVISRASLTEFKNSIPGDIIPATGDGVAGVANPDFPFQFFFGACFHTAVEETVLEAPDLDAWACELKVIVVVGENENPALGVEGLNGAGHNGDDVIGFGFIYFHNMKTVACFQLGNEGLVDIAEDGTHDEFTVHKSADEFAVAFVIRENLHTPDFITGAVPTEYDIGEWDIVSGAEAIYATQVILCESVHKLDVGRPVVGFIEIGFGVEFMVPDLGREETIETEITGIYE